MAKVAGSIAVQVSVAAADCTNWWSEFILECHHNRFAGVFGVSAAATSHGAKQNVSSKRTSR